MMMIMNKFPFFFSLSLSFSLIFLGLRLDGGKNLWHIEDIREAYESVPKSFVKGKADVIILEEVLRLAGCSIIRRVWR